MLAFIAFFATNTFAQDTADEVLASHFEAMGGLEKMKAIKSLKMTGKVPTPQGDFNFIQYNKQPNLMRTEVDIQGKLMIPQAFDGTTAWTINPFAGGDKAQKLPEEQAKEMLDQATMESALIDYKEKGHKLELEGKEEVDGAEAFKLKLTKFAGKENEKVEYHFIDSESFAPIMTKSTISTGPQKGMVVEMYMSEYDEVNGVYMPFYMETRMNGQVGQKITVEKIEANVDLEDKLFNF